ncbi:MAG: pyridoxal phosphate-dependent aminotransferase, partial [Muribaculaceae bacterium]|nr:pyridoxal phosphate-dependent aminotransferase [Muribaculaceae bacterium]
MFPVERNIFDRAKTRCGIIDLGSATIRQICALAAELETIAAEESVHLEMGNPGLPASAVGVEAERRALAEGCAGIYPNIAGIPALKDAGEQFIKAFMDLDIPARCIIPTVGSMQACFTLLLLLGQRQPGRDTILYLAPGFPVQRNQAKLLGLNTRSFDIYSYRGEAMEKRLRQELADGRVTALIYSNPNNPAWTNFTEQELEIIGRLCTEFDVIAIEDVAYFAMDFRTDFSHPFNPPYPPSIGRYTYNYIMMLSSSKIFSYAGQRIALACFSPAVFDRQYPFLQRFYEMPTFGDAYVFGVLYCASSGTSHSAQYAMTAMLNAATRGELNFVAE